MTNGIIKTQGKITIELLDSVIVSNDGTQYPASFISINVIGKTKTLAHFTIQKADLKKFVSLLK